MLRYQNCFDLLHAISSSNDELARLSRETCSLAEQVVYSVAPITAVSGMRLFCKEWVSHVHFLTNILSLYLNSNKSGWGLTSDQSSWTIRITVLLERSMSSMFEIQLWKRERVVGVSEARRGCITPHSLYFPCLTPPSTFSCSTPIACPLPQLKFGPVLIICVIIAGSQCHYDAQSLSYPTKCSKGRVPFSIVIQNPV